MMPPSISIKSLLALVVFSLPVLSIPLDFGGANGLPVQAWGSRDVKKVKRCKGPHHGNDNSTSGSFFPHGGNETRPSGAWPSSGRHDHHHTSSAVGVLPSASTSAAASSAAVETSASVLASDRSITSSNDQTSTSTSQVQIESTSSTAPAPSSPPASTTVSSAAASATSSSTDGGSSDADLFVKLHSDFRAEYGTGVVTWNTTMAAYAANAANSCKYGHTGGPYGENIAAGVGGGYDITAGFNSWANEASKYDWNNPGYSDATGHFTQIVWKATTQIGCAAATCADNTIFQNFNQDSLYIVCEYYSPGNVVGNNGQYFADNVGKKV